MVSPTTDAPERSETEAVAALVEKYLLRHQSPDYRIVVRQGAIRQGARRWLVEVGVEPAAATVRADDFVDRITRTNEEIDRDYPRFVRLTQLVPQPAEVL
ncbi:MAG TPA: hypothetical protein VFC78_10405 [Tepidisphaeraceae bacterium]|nr:hypothetical protein [Tepidisphaeraceae bacterium]